MFNQCCRARENWAPLLLWIATFPRDSNTSAAAERTKYKMARLSGWKEIASHLQTSVRTVQRWERTESLPIHRHYHRRGTTSYAISEELDSWLRDRSIHSRGVKVAAPSIGAMFDLIGQQDALINKLRVVIEDQRSLSRQIADARQDLKPLPASALKEHPDSKIVLQLVPGARE